MGHCSWAGLKAEAEGKEVRLALGFWVRVDLDPVHRVFLTRLRHIFRRGSSLLSVAFSLPILVPFLPFPLFLLFLFPSWTFCGSTIPTTTYLRTFKKTQFFDLGYKRRRVRKSTKRTLSYCAILRNPSRDDNYAFGIGFRVVWDSSEKLETRRRYSKSLSLVFSYFLSFHCLQVFRGVLGVLG